MDSDTSLGSAIEIDLSNDNVESSTLDESQNRCNQNDSVNTSKKLVMSRKDIENLIVQNSDRISTDAKDAKRKSGVWKRFSRITVDGIPQDCVICDSCKTTYAWKSKSGTKSMNRHICDSKTATIKRGPAKSLTDGKSESIETYLMKVVPPHAKAALNKSIAFGLAKDLHSLRTVEGTGFQHMAQALVNFGAKYGRQRIEGIIQHRTTLRDHYIRDMCNETRQIYKTLFEKMPRLHKFAFSKDLWSEK